MSEKKYSLHEVTESLRISPDTLYRWENQIPNLKPQHCDGGRLYTSWEFDLVQHAHRLFHNYNQDFAGTRSALERWISKNPKPIQSQQESSDDLEAINASQVMDAIAESSGSQEVSLIEVKEVTSVVATETRLPSVSMSPKSIDRLADTQEAPHSVIQQGGGKRRVIGRTSEDLFSDLDSDPFDLSPKPRGEINFSLGTATATSVDQARLLTPSLIDMEKTYSSEWSHAPQRVKPTERIEKPSNSDWLEVSTSVEIDKVPAPSQIQSKPSQIQSKPSQIQSKPSQAQSKPSQAQSSMDAFSPHRAFSHSKIDDGSRSINIEPNASMSSHDGFVENTSNLPVTSNSLQLDSPSEVLKESGSRIDSPLTPIPVKRSIKSPYGANKPMTISTFSSPTTATQSHLHASLSNNYMDKRRDVKTSDTHAKREVKPSQIPIPTDQSDQEAWQRAYHHSQAQLARAKGELARAEDNVNHQHKEIKHLKTQLLSVKESILKEIYDLRDLVVDK